MSRRKQAKPRSLKPEDEDWNEGAPRDASEMAASDNHDDDSQDRDKDGADESNIEEITEDAEDTHTDEKPADDYEVEMADMADIKTESMDSFESGCAARLNTTPPFTANKMLTLLQEACSQVTPDNWRKVVEKTKKLCLDDWNRDVRYDNIVDQPFLINIRESSCSSDSESETQSVTSLSDSD